MESYWDKITQMYDIGESNLLIAHPLYLNYNSYSTPTFCNYFLYNLNFSKFTGKVHKTNYTIIIMSFDKTWA